MAAIDLLATVSLSGICISRKLAKHSQKTNVYP